MSGTVDGASKAKKTIRSRHGKDFYARIGRKGGRRSRTGGFASLKVGDDGLTGQQRARIAGARGGLKSRRGKAVRPVRRQSSTDDE